MNLFNSESDRELWIKLNAERQINCEKSLTWFNKKTIKNESTLQALNPRTLEQALKISRCQCEYDEKQGKLRFSFEELLLLNIKELNIIKDKIHQKWYKKWNQ